MRVLSILVWVLFAVGLMEAQQAAQMQAKKGPACGDPRGGIPYVYYQAVLASITPPGSKNWLISVMLVEEKNVVLWTDGRNFTLWVSTPDLPQKSISDFLWDLDRSCRLPSDPVAAAALIKTKWKSEDLSEAEFNELHREFAAALSQYVANIPTHHDSMMKERTVVAYVDTALYTVIYDNHENHVEIHVWDDPKPVYQKPIVEWLRKFRNSSEGNVAKMPKPHE